MTLADTDQDLARWLMRVAAGDRGAFEALYRASAGALLGVCFGVLKDRAEAEDVLQDVFVSIWSKAAQFDPSRSRAHAWLASIARHRAIDRIRARSPSSKSDHDAPESIPDSAPTPPMAAERASVRARLDECMARIDERARALIHTAFFDGVSYQALADRAGTPLGTVKSWIRRGLLQLRACLEQ